VTLATQKCFYSSF